MDRIDTMLAFTRVVELNSFTKASVSLNLPKATLSAQVLALEKRLQVRLLNRTTRHVSVTPDGAAYYERCVRLLNELEEMEASLTRPAEPSGRLRVDVPGAIGRRIIIPALGDFYRRYPQIRLELGCTDRPVDLVQEGIDCVIRGGPAIDESLAARRLGDIEVITVASPAYLAEHGTPAVPQDIARHRYVGFFSRRSGKPGAFYYLDQGARAEVDGLHCLAVNDMDALVAAAESGLGIAQIPEYTARRGIQAGKLTRILADYAVEPVPLCILYPQNRHLPSRVRAFIEWSAALFAEANFILASRHDQKLR